MSDQLSALGAIPINAPLIKTKASVIDQLPFGSLADFDWIFFASVNAVRCFFDWLGESNIAAHTRAACVGPQTAIALCECFREADFVPDPFTSQALGAQAPEVANSRVLIPGPKSHDKILASILNDRGAQVTCWPIYETVAVPLSESNRQQLESGIDVVTFASPSAVDSFCDQVSDFQVILSQTTVACIGPKTQRRALEREIPVAIVPQTFTVSGLIQALADHFAN